MKIKFEKTQVLLIDEVTKDRWIVEFTGNHGNLEGRVYKNGIYVTTYSPCGGHANKTMAIMIVKNISQK